jgi:hypothetical protein
MRASDLETAILELLHQRGDGLTICPSEAARAVAGHDWRPLMGESRAAAARLAERGEIEVLQRGQPVNALEARGPIRLRLRA